MWRANLALEYPKIWNDLFETRTGLTRFDFVGQYQECAGAVTQPPAAPYQVDRTLIGEVQLLHQTRHGVDSESENLDLLFLLGLITIHAELIIYIEMMDLYRDMYF